MQKYKEETTFRQNLKKYLKAYNEKTGIHGLHYLTEERSKLEKFVWAVILLISLTCCFLMIYGILMKFEKTPVVVSFSTKYTPIYEIPFPSVTICPEVKFTHEFFNYTDVYLQFISKNGRISEELWHKFLYFALICNEDDEHVLKSGAETVGEDFFEVLERALPYILSRCKFLGEEYDFCKGILTPVITDLGICYSFNILDRSEVYRDHVVHYKNFHRVANYSQQNHFKEFAYTKDAGLNSHPKRALYAGASSSFDVLLVENLNNSDYICTKFYQGYRISFHNPVDIPRLSKNYVRLPVDRTMVAAVKPEKIVTSAHLRYMSPDKRQCYWMNERYLRHFKIYSQSNCMLECLTNFTLMNCGCVDFYMPRDNNTRICGIKKKICLQEAEMKLQTNDLHLNSSGKDGEDYCDCKPACTEINFSAEMSHSQLFYSKYINTVNQGAYVLDDKYRFSSVSVYVKDRQFMALERNELYGISDLICDFGGLLGLFTGFSLISLIEIIYCLTLRIFYNRKLYGSWAGQDQV